MLFRHLYGGIHESHQRERQRIRQEFAQIHGLIPMLMKPRNGEHWTEADRAVILYHLHELAGMSLYLFPLVLPGGVLMLPVLAWWLDRRRGKRS